MKQELQSSAVHQTSLSFGPALHTQSPQSAKSCCPCVRIDENHFPLLVKERKSFLSTFAFETISSETEQSLAPTLTFWNLGRSLQISSNSCLPMQSYLQGLGFIPLEMSTHNSGVNPAGCLE